MNIKYNREKTRGEELDKLALNNMSTTMGAFGARDGVVNSTELLSLGSGELLGPTM